MQRLNYDAIGLGELEFGQWALTDSLMAANPLPIVCTNVERLVGEEWKQIGDRYRIINRCGIRIGVVSVIDKIQLSNIVLKKSDYSLRLLDPVETVKGVIDEISPQTDMIVLLGHLDSKALEGFASSVKGIDVALGGHMTKKDEGPLLIADAVINRSGTRGMHLASTRLILSPENEIVDFGGKNITLTADHPEDPVVADRALSAKAKTDELRRERNTARREKAKAQANLNKQKLEESKNVLSPKASTKDSAPE